MAEKLKSILQMSYLMMKGYDPVCFVKEDRSLTKRGPVWDINGYGSYPDMRAALESSTDVGEGKWRRIQIEDNMFYVSDKAEIRDEFRMLIKPFSDGHRNLVKLPFTMGSGMTRFKTVPRDKLVAYAFLDVRFGDGWVIHHVNGDAFDDSVENLLPVTKAEHERLLAEGPRKEEKAEVAEEAAPSKRKLTLPEILLEGEKADKVGEAVEEVVEEPAAEPVTYEATFTIDLRVDSNMRVVMVDALRRIESTRPDDVEAWTHLAPVLVAMEDMRADKDMVGSFDELLFGLRCMSKFLAERPGLRSGPLLVTLGRFYDELASVVEAVGRKETVTRMLMAEIVESEAVKEQYAAIGYAAKMRGLCALANGKGGR